MVQWQFQSFILLPDRNQSVHTCVQLLEFHLQKSFLEVDPMSRIPGSFFFFFEVLHLNSSKFFLLGWASPELSLQAL